MVAEQITANKLYELTNCPEFIGQTAADNDGNYTVYWQVQGVKYKTLCNLL